MGKGTDKLYITHSEWSSDAAYSASAGAGLTSSGRSDESFKRLPFNFCAISLQPFHEAVCISPEQPQKDFISPIFDIDNILPWLEKHGTDPVSGQRLSIKNLVNLRLHKNEQGEYIDPVTFKPLTDHSHIVVVRPSGYVYLWDTVERLNVRPKMWSDLMTDQLFTRSDIITLQDPQRIAARDLSSFKHVREGAKVLTPEQERERSSKINKIALGSGAKTLGNGVGKYLNQNESAANDKPMAAVAPAKKTATTMHTTGRAAASLTSTGLTPDTSGALVEMSQEEYLLQPKRVKDNGYATVSTSHGDLEFELLTEQAPRAVWNFIKLAQKDYYKNVLFHRNIPGFMLQGGDPGGTGRGGTSIWGKPFKDEWPRSNLSHDHRGVISMANKGKDTNTSQFFITYGACAHLDRKHTIFGTLSSHQCNENTLLKTEQEPVSEPEKRPKKDITIIDINVFVDPFAEYLIKQDETLRKESQSRTAGDEEAENTTWTGRVIGDTTLSSAPIGRYVADAATTPSKLDSIDQQPRKKRKVTTGEFGNFDGW